MVVQIKDAVEDPGYDAAGSSTSRATITFFIATFAYLVFTSDARPGFVGGTIFFFAGIFVVSLAISMPLFLLRVRVPQAGLLISAADIAGTIIITRAAYLWLFTSLAVPAVPFMVECGDPIPMFTLNYDSNPSEAEVNQLCRCMRDELGKFITEIERISSEMPDEADKIVLERMNSVLFGRAVDRCGGMDM